MIELLREALNPTNNVSMQQITNNLLQVDKDEQFVPILVSIITDASLDGLSLLT